VVLSDGAPRVTEAGTVGSASFRTQCSKKWPLQFWCSENELRASKAPVKASQSSMAFRHSARQQAVPLAAGHQISSCPVWTTYWD